MNFHNYLPRMAFKLSYALSPLLVLFILANIAGLLSYLFVSLSASEIPIRKIISKVTQLFLLLSIFPIIKWLSLSKEKLGFSNLKPFTTQVFWGFLLGLLSLLPVILMLFSLEIRILTDFSEWSIKVAILSLLLALLIGLVEETIFRGTLLTTLSTRIGLLSGVLLSSVYYAGLHFLRSKTHVPLEDLTWTTSFQLIYESFGSIFKYDNFDSLLALLFVGLFLACVRLKLRQSIGICVGIHTGWVFIIKMTKKVSEITTASDTKFLVGSYDGIIGYLVVGWLCFLILLFMYYYRNQETVLH